MNAGDGHRAHRWRRLLQLLLPRWRGYLLIWALTMASSAVALLQPWPVKVLVDHVFADVPPPPWLSFLLAFLPATGTAMEIAVWVAAASLLIFMLDAVVDVALTVSWLRVAQRGVYDLGAALFSRLQRRSILFHARTPIGDSLARITGDSWCIYNAATALIFTPMHALILGGAMVAILASLNPTLTLVALAATPILALATLSLGNRAQQAKTVERGIESQIESHVQQTLSGIRVVQSYAQEDREHGRFQTLAGKAVRANRRSAFITAFSAGAAGLATTGATGAVLGLGAREVIGGRLEVGELLVFLAYLATLNAQLVNLANTYIAARGLTANVDRVLAVLDSPRDLPERADAKTLSPAVARVEFRNVSFAYETGRPVLRNVNFHIAHGSFTGIVGPSGAGKSTLALLIPRLLDPTEGSVLIGGEDLRSLSLASLRRPVALVLQEPMLSADTLAANIALGRPEATRQEIQAAAEAAQLGSVLRRLDDGLDTVLGESGANLSGGERQRVAIARALLRNAPILAMDEPTSALDAHTESALMESLIKARRGQTTIVIAHRLSTIRQADRIVVMEHGEIVEQGDHAELMRRSGPYARLWLSQQGRDAEAQTQESLA